jgi:Tfp pilus assembly protein PilF
MTMKGPNLSRRSGCLVTHFAAALSFVVGVGCVTQPAGPSTSNNGLPPGKEVVAEKDQPRLALKATACVAFGKFQLEAARDGNRGPAQREQLLDTARKYFQQALKIDPKCGDAYLGLARTYQDLGDTTRCVATYDTALKIFPKDPTFYFELGMFQAKQKDWASALANLKTAVSLDPENRNYLNTYGYTLARAGRFEESFACFKPTVGEAQARYNIARMLHHVQQDDASKIQLRLALQIDPGLADARKLLNELDNPTPSPSRTTAAAGFESVENGASKSSGAPSQGSLQPARTIN